MKNWLVTFHAEGWTEIEVEAETRQEALEQAYELVDDADVDWVYDAVDEIG